VPALFVIYATVFIDLLGFGIILPSLPFFAKEYGATGTWVGAIVTAYSAAQFLGAPILGRISDRVGRRPVLLLSLVGSTISLALSGMADGLWLLLGARALAGLFGGSISTAQACVADLTTPAQRGRAMGLLGASIGLGFVFGPALGALLGHAGFAVAAFTAAGLAAGNALLAFFVLPETRREGMRQGHSRPGLQATAHAFRVSSLRVLLGATFLTTFGFVAMEATFALLAEQRFGLDAHDLGLSFAFAGVVMVVVQGGLVGRAALRFGERRVALSGALLMALGLVLLPFVGRLGLSLGALGVLSAGQGLAGPMLSTLISRLSADGEQGSTLGLGQAAAAAARAVGPLAAGAIYDFAPWSPYVLSALLCLVTAGLVGSGSDKR
jgi:DHA1 family tetracycline resistance protein-like MFS transporter